MVKNINICNKVMVKLMFFCIKVTLFNSTF